MSAVAVPAEEAQVNISPLTLVVMAVAVVLLFSYIALPWVNQPELGPSTVAQFTESRSSNELDVTTSGLPLIPMGAGAVLLVGLWTLLFPQNNRPAALMMALGGVLALTYFVVFFSESLEEDPDRIGAMAAGFWLALAASVLLVLQAVIPREKVPGHGYIDVLGNQETVLALVLIALMLIVGVINPRYLAERNLSDIIAGNAYIAVAAIGISMVIISGNIDISVGSLIGVLAFISGSIALEGPIWLAWLAPLVVGAGFGAFIGFLIAFLRIPSIIVTLGMLSILKGGLIIVTQGDRITNMPSDFFLAQMRPLGIPMPIYFMVILTILGALWLRYSGTGRALYAVGGNREAARLSGISRRRIVMTAFIINGVTAGIASVLYATQLGVIQATPPPALELTIITASVVGGVSILGGTGTVIGSTLAALLLNAIRSGMIFINVSAFWLQAVQGTLILVTVLVDLLRRRRQLGG